MGPDPRSREQNQLPGEGGVDIRLAGGWIEVASNVHPPGEVVVSMRPVSVFAKSTGSEIEQLRAELRGRWRQAARAVMVLLSLHGLPPAQIAALLDCHPRYRAPLDQPVQPRRDRRAGRPAPVRAASAGRPPADRPDRRAAQAAGPVDPAADPAVPGLAAGQRAHAVPAGPAGGGMAAAQADRPRRPGP